MIEWIMNEWMMIKWWLKDDEWLNDWINEWMMMNDDEW